ncbi:hypothetical protein GE061_017170 [Apolygus lucorum]|uniref:Uncharacterized protein n=1 Tax=Apolygus lucorum TaxID=248454 RepID=A0A8S9XI87_APOLU|nr:hypothetical protein GE061_017170 [Apolygus lucorum]
MEPDQHCSICNKETDDEQLLCEWCSREETISSIQDQCHGKQKQAAEKMQASSSKLHDEINVGDNVVVTVPKFDRGPLDCRNVRGIILEERNGFFRVGTAAGILKNLCSRDQLAKTFKNTEESEVLRDKLVTLRETVTFFSLFEGQGIILLN